MSSTAAPVVPYPRVCLHEAIETQCAATPSRIAVWCAGKTLTYAELDRRATQLARHLRQRGVQPRDLVGLSVERSLDLMVGLLGILKTGAAYVPVDPAYPVERRRVILEEARVSMLVVQQALTSALDGFNGDVVCIDTVRPEGARCTPDHVPSGIDVEDRAYVMFTSGSTGRPKGVQIPHRALVNLLSCMRRELHVEEDDVMLALASFAFDMCIPELYLPLLAGAAVAIAPRDLAADGERLWQTMRETKTTIMQATPTAWGLLLKTGFRGAGLKAICGAEPLPMDVCEPLLERVDRLYHFYGPTETTVWSTFDVLEKPAGAVTIGRPLDNQQVFLTNRQLEPVGEGEIGEVLIGGDGLALGYLGQPALTAERFVPNPFDPRPGARMYRTSDLARWLQAGRLMFAGRADHQVKIRGFRIELSEIEIALRRHPRVSDAVVVVREDDGDKRLVAYVVGDRADRIDPAELRTALAAALPDYMVPATFVVLDELPRLPNGKISRNLPAPPRARHVIADAAPRTSSEAFLAAAWAEVLHLDAIGVTDDVFALGAHSLLVTQVSSRVRSRYGVELSLHAIFDSPQIATLAAELDRLLQDANAGGPAVAPDRIEPVERIERFNDHNERMQRAPAFDNEAVPTSLRRRSESELEAALPRVAGERSME